jgi:hypothetical protein
MGGLDGCSSKLASEMTEARASSVEPKKEEEKVVREDSDNDDVEILLIIHPPIPKRPKQVVRR